ncbi:hypothetical protein HIM_06225 [Hirsutella minnesotensis 3608]|uniref:Amidohydrolase-related domain-containing protein n=1 Tax=Hirsutella minnesotensis 3608 TaxID=1043627 RepID=A0A0F7ZNV6_9HYPO|nr:hypothetical protein HIM_06225 [Hirsutella minnesotensis 3608]
MTGASSESLPPITGVRLPNRPMDTLWDVTFSNGSSTNPTPHIDSIRQARSPAAVPSPPVVLPALVHPHVHLDKAFLYFSPEYADLIPTQGGFDEALSGTARAKSRFTLPGLLRRGRMLLEESVGYGVTAIRAFVEVDSTVRHLCLEAAIELKQEWSGKCHLQVVCFAQDAVFSGPHGEENRQLMIEAAKRPGVDVIGTTPYVEADGDAARRNIEWAAETALRLDKHLDFHLDYNLDVSKEPMIWHVIKTLKALSWPSKSHKCIMIGHATRLTLFSQHEWKKLAVDIQDAGLPIAFVGLPSSDVYMACAPGIGESQPRGTLSVCELVRRHGLNAVIGVNNVGNAFTPWGSCDPLALASLCVGIYQAGTQADAQLLYECVSSRARVAMGLSSASADVREGDAADLLVVRGLRRGSGSPAEMVWDPSAARERETVFEGRSISGD